MTPVAMSKETQLEKNSTHWYLLYCKGKEEERASIHLANQGIKTFYPKAKVTKIRRGKKSTLVEPMFPNYLFVQLSEHHNFTSVRSTRGVIGFVKTGIHYQKVPELIVRAFQEQIALPEFSEKLPKKGDKVVLDTPTYKNFTAIYQESKGETRSLLLINLINKPVLLEVENQDFTTVNN